MTTTIVWAVLLALKIAAVIHWSWWIVIFWPLAWWGAWIALLSGISALLTSKLT